MKGGIAIFLVLAAIITLARLGKENDDNTRAAGTANEAWIAPGSLTGEWPFTSNGGTLRCDPQDIGGAVTFEADGTVYAINGTALSLGLGKDIRTSSVWRDTGDPVAPKLDIGSVIERGLELCGS